MPRSLFECSLRLKSSSSLSSDWGFEDEDEEERMVTAFQLGSGRGGRERGVWKGEGDGGNF